MQKVGGYHQFPSGATSSSMAFRSTQERFGIWALTVIVYKSKMSLACLEILPFVLGSSVACTGAWRLLYFFAWCTRLLTWHLLVVMRTVNMASDFQPLSVSSSERTPLLQPLFRYSCLHTRSTVSSAFMKWSFVFEMDASRVVVVWMREVIWWCLGTVWKFSSFPPLLVWRSFCRRRLSPMTLEKDIAGSSFGVRRC